ncbi:signal peptidase II [Candidatus Pelagibacter sp.]|nr:signal peptidase II [Candidatus Pelagibacter sp.]
MIKKNFFINSSFILLIFLLDRVSKIYVINLDMKFLEAEIFSSKFLNIILVWNEGIAFGLLSFGEETFYNSLTILIIIIIFIIYIMMIRSSGLKKYALIMILGGALGNLYDRIFFKAVPDFIDFHVQDFHWFIFNVADIFISMGVFFMILFELIDNNKNKYEKI